MSWSNVCRDIYPGTEVLILVERIARMPRDQHHLGERIWGPCMPELIIRDLTPHQLEAITRALTNAQVPHTTDALTYTVTDTVALLTIWRRANTSCLRSWPSRTVCFLLRSFVATVGFGE